jgi:hypothetical protein
MDSVTPIGAYTYKIASPKSASTIFAAKTLNFASTGKFPSVQNPRKASSSSKKVAMRRYSS